jgi:signal transduction histidine kinase
LLPLLEVRIATDEQAVVHARAAALQRQLLLLVGCGFIACAGMAFLAVRYRAEKNRVQGLLRSQHDAAAAAVQAKGKMLSIMSHELRTPLSGMLGISDLLAETPLTSEQSELLRTLQQAGRNLRDLIDNALDHERLSASRMPFESLPVDWRHKLHQVERLMRPAFAQAHVGLSCTVDDAVPAAVLGDPLRTRQVLLNLLGNALRFTPRDGLVHVHVRLTDGGRTLRCSVADTGPGIPLDRQAAIFEPFTQADKTVARQFGGTGLGLTICRLIITGLGGRIGVDSQVGRGSTFWFELPATPAAPSAPQRGDTTSLTGARPLGLRVLVAEDDAISAFTVTHMLDKLGCTCLRVENGSEAVQAAATGTYDVILLDVQMPVMDGHAAARAIRAAESGRRTPILALSAATEAEDRTAAQAAGMDALVAKPITLAELRAALRRTQPA